MIEHMAKLPFGYSCIFRWHHGGQISAEWQPDVPEVRSPRHRRRFLEAYDRERAQFLSEVATVTGKVIGVVNLHGGELSICRPLVRH
jgi:hypothetical protein